VHSTPPTNTPIDTTRRRFLTVAAGASVASVGTLAVAAMPAAGSDSAACAVDPIDAAIERYKDASAAHTAALDELARLEKCDPDWDHGWITEQPCHDEFAAFDALLAAAATTLPGLLAKLAYLQDIAEHNAWLFDNRQGATGLLIESFAASIAAFMQVRP
jgi:hypothetical protein